MEVLASKLSGRSESFKSTKMIHRLRKEPQVQAIDDHIFLQIDERLSVRFRVGSYDEALLVKSSSSVKGCS